MGRARGSHVARLGHRLRSLPPHSPTRTPWASPTRRVDVLRSLDLEPLCDSDESALFSHFSANNDSDMVTANSNSDNDIAYSTDVCETKKWCHNL